MRLPVCLACAVLTGAAFLRCDAQPPNPPSSGDSGQAFIIEASGENVDFSSDGTWRIEQSVRVRIQSEAGIQQFGVLTFSYRGDAERVEIEQIRVTRRDGTVVDTPLSSAQDLPAEVTREAPTYSDAREKQVPVKALGIGDLLEWKVRTIRSKADVPGHFWYSYSFGKDQVVLSETLRVTVPADRYVKVSSPSLTPQVRTENGRKIYLWNTSHRAVPKDDDKQPAANPRFRPDVQLSTFQSWEEVGRWYGELQKPRLELSPAIRARAAELTAGLTTNAEKQRAIYQFVASKFRYISISFGEGRYQPHSAGEVLANQYGDCKDKHTLLAALLQAAGIEAWPVLIGAGVELAPEVPSPGQFNHVITYLPGGETPTWLDATPEVAPYGMLQFSLRDRQALLIPNNGAAKLVTTPQTLPFAASETFTADTKLADDGTLTGRFDISERGDSEIVLRNAFYATAPAQWNTLAQNLLRGMGFAGTVHGLDLANLHDLDAPFRFSFDYERKGYSDWAGRRITPPLPPFSISYSEDEEKPADPLELGAPMKTLYRAIVKSPEGYSVELPANVKLQTGIADYTATYSVDRGVLTAERTLVIKVPKVQLSQWEEYRSFAKTLVDDESRFIQLVRAASSGAVQVTRDSAEAADLLQKGAQALQNRDLNTARDAFSQAERINPQQSGLWMAYGFLYGMQNDVDKAIECLQKEVRFHPGNEAAYTLLAAAQHQAARKQDEIDTRRKLVAIAPGNVDAVLALSSVLVEDRSYEEAATAVRAALKENPADAHLELALLESLVRGGRKTEGLAVLADFRKHSPDANMLNSAAWALADTATEPALARDISAQAIADFEARLKDVTLPELTTGQLKVIDALGATWDTLGWAYYLLGDLTAAEKYLRSSWLLIQYAGVADHLGQLYERQGKKQEAIHAYRLALAVNSDSPETRRRLENLGGAADGRPTLRRGRPTNAPPAVSPQEELSRLRTTPLPSIARKSGSAEFFLLFSAAGVEDVRFIRGEQERSRRARQGAL